MSYLDDLEEHHDTPGRWLLYAALTVPLLLRSLFLGVAIVLAQVWDERPRRAPRPRRQDSPLFWKVVRIAWAPYLLVLAGLLTIAAIKHGWIA